MRNSRHPGAGATARESAVLSSRRMARAPWSDSENDLIVAEYFAMLRQDLAGREYNKAERNREFVRLTGRSRSSVEYKLRNISAVLQLSGETWLPGYRPALNFQASLGDAVARWLVGNQDFLHRDTVTVQRSVRELRLIIVPPPSLANEPPPKEVAKVQPLVRKFDFAARDARNRDLGRAGERLAFEHERLSLSSAGRPDLAERVRWISEEEGDGAGYDIASFRHDGRDRLMEVKTTNGWERTPFYLTPNEVEVADSRREAWCLFRVWNYEREPRAFELHPPLENHVALAPASFLASFR